MKRDQIERLKHNTRLDVRMPDQLKDEFLARCREEGVSSGAVIRSLILDFLFPQPITAEGLLMSLKESLVKRAKWIAGGLAGTAAAVFAASGALMGPVASADAEQVVVDFRPAGEAIPEGARGAIAMFQSEQDDGDTYLVTVTPRECEMADLDVDAGCNTAFDLRLMRTGALGRTLSLNSETAQGVEGLQTTDPVGRLRLRTDDLQAASMSLQGEPIGQLRIVHGDKTSVVAD